MKLGLGAFTTAAYAELSLGYPAAVLTLLLWPATLAPFLVPAAFLGLLAAASFAAVGIIERRRPWPFGPRPIRPPSKPLTLVQVASMVIALLVAGSLSELMDPSVATALLIGALGLGLAVGMLSTVWTPLQRRFYPDVPNAQGG